MMRGTGFHSRERGAALVMVIGILAVLIVISATFWQLTRQEMQTSTNTANRIRADLIADGGLAIAIAFLNHDRVIHPTATSVDFAYKSYFNGAWAVGKPWMWADGNPIVNGGVPEIPEFDPSTPQGQFLNRVARNDSMYIPRLQQGPDPTTSPGAFGPFVTVPGPTAQAQPHPLQNLGIPLNVKEAIIEDTGGNALRVQVDLNQTNNAVPFAWQTPQDQIHAWTDVDNDGDGFNDSIWIPIGRDRILDNDGLDNDLNRLVWIDDGLDNDGDGDIDEADEGIDEPGERGIFLYWGGDDGVDNDCDGIIDDDNEQRIYLTTSQMFVTVNGAVLDPVTFFNWSLAIGPLAEELYDQTASELVGGIQVDCLDNDFSLVANDALDAGHILNRAAYGIDAATRIYAEPVSDLVGRVAILIRDEASKVNMNSAGGLSIDMLDLDSGTPMRRALNRGISPHEYDLRVLEGIGDAFADRMWTIRMGGPGGRAMATNGYSGALDPLNLDFGNFAFDVSLPGYGRVDDNGNALWMTMNGIDDDGDGLIDEGIRFDPTLGLSEGINAYLGQDLEGVDEPGEWQRFRPYRNFPAENDGDLNDGIDGDFDGNTAEIDGDNDNDGITDEIGELGDRFLRTHESLKLVSGIAAGRFNNLRNDVTAHSTDRNERFNYRGFARTVPRLRNTAGVKLDYRYARAPQIAEMLQQDFGYLPTLPTAGIDLVPAAVKSFALALRQEDTSVLTGSVTGILGLDPIIMGDNNLPFFLSDPRLRTYQLGVNVKDYGDANHTRTQAESFVNDDWWSTFAANFTNSPDPLTASLALAARTQQIYYTQSGIESIRINEMMVRPVRRFEAEATTDTDIIYYGDSLDPNFFADPASGSGNEPARDFSMFPTFDEINFTENDPSGGWAPYGDDFLLGARTAFAIYNIYNLTPQGEPVPNIAQFSFQASPQLPPGRYYVLLNATVLDTDPVSPTFGQMINTVVDPGDFSFQFRVGSAAEGIINNPAFRDDQNDNGRWRSPAVLGRDGFGNLTGLAFLQNDMVDPPGLDDGLDTIGFTVEIPPAIDENNISQFLHIAVRKENPDPNRPFAVNFFEFSQEPDHEWVEVVNIAETGLPIDLSGWELVVEGQKRRSMRIPEDTFIAPGGSLLLAVNKLDYFETLSAGIPTTPVNMQASGFFVNGIGLARGDFAAMPNFANVSVPPTFAPVPTLPPPAEQTFSVFHRIEQGDYIDRFGDGGESEAGTAEDALQSTLPLSPETASATKAWDRIVQLEVQELEGRFTPALIGALVLDGGIFPNYPEHDGIDNDGDRFFLNRDLIDNNGDAVVGAIAGSTDPGAGATVDPAFIDESTEGIDEGRFRRDGGIPGFGAPGSFNRAPVLFTSLFTGILNPDESTGGAAAARPFAYLGSQSDPPQWKEFVERRLYPGDNVIVTLYEGASLENRVADRVTYTEQDVVNAAIDDIIEIPVSRVSQLLDDRYPSFWPNDTMGVDFYRTLERKHPLYSGDRFGTRNRFQATDGNYDDWSAATGRYERHINDIGAVLSTVDRFTSASVVYNLFSHAYFGSPLRMNLSQRIAENPGNQFGAVIGGVALDRQWPLQLSRVRNQTYVSPGDLVGLPHFERTDLLFGEIDYNYLFDLASVNQAFEATNVGVVGHQDQTIVQALLGQVFRQRYLSFVGDVELANINLPRFNADYEALIGNGAAMDSLELTVGQADVIPLNGNAPVDYIWHPLLGTLPEGWAPVLLHELQPGPGDDSNVTFASLGFPPFPKIYLLDLPGTLPDSVDNDRWPLPRRAAFYISGNFQGDGSGAAPTEEEYLFNQESVHEDVNGDGLGTESLFIWNGGDGLENGEYDLFLGVGESLQALQGSPILTQSGTVLVNAINNLRPSERLVDVEVFTDRDGDRRVWSPAVPVLTNGGQLNRIARDPQTSGGVQSPRESFGMQLARTPNDDGFIHYGVVRVENNFLAVRLRNWTTAGRPLTFSRVILAPHKKTPGRININTTMTRYIPETALVGSTFNPELFNPLVGLPGILFGFDTDLQPVSPGDTTPPPLSGSDSLLAYHFALLDGTTLPDSSNVNEFAIYHRANVLSLERPAQFDGRYYQFFSDLVEPIPVDTDGIPSAVSNRPPVATRYPFFLSNIGDPLFTADDPLRLLEIANRFSRIANTITVRSDVFEIIVTAQSGYGVDANGDGRINYRSNDEFVVNAERRVRQVYER